MLDISSNLWGTGWDPGCSVVCLIHRCTVLVRRESQCLFQNFSTHQTKAKSPAFRRPDKDEIGLMSV